MRKENGFNPQFNTSIKERNTMENNNEMKWVNLTYEKTVRSYNTGRFLTSLDPKMVELWLNNVDKNSKDIESLTHSEEWEESGPRYINLKTEIVVDEKYSGEGELDLTIQSWIDSKRVDMTSIFGSGHNPLEIQDFISEHQELFNKLTTRKTVFHLKDNEKSVYYSLRKIVGLEGKCESDRNYLTPYVKWVNTEGKGKNGYVQLKEEGWVRRNDETYEKLLLERGFSKEEIEDCLIVERNQEEYIQRQEEEQDEIDRPIPPVQSPKDNVVQMRKRTSSI